MKTVEELEQQLQKANDHIEHLKGVFMDHIAMNAPNRCHWLRRWRGGGEQQNEDVCFNHIEDNLKCKCRHYITTSDYISQLEHELNIRNTTLHPCKVVDDLRKALRTEKEKIARLEVEWRIGK